MLAGWYGSAAPLELPHWRGPVYPSDAPECRWLELYAERFDTVEVASFYRLPT
jgi:uncharacterized protein YecE (DUF72 family)